MKKVLALVPCLVLAACGLSEGQEKGGKKGGGPLGFPPPEVTVVTVQPRSLPVTFEYAGQSAGSREAEVRPRVAGIIVRRNFDEGKPVKEGQSLYSIDPAPFEAAVAKAEADVAAADAREQQARRNAARLKPLIADKAVSQKELDDALSAESIGAADLKAAKAQLVQAKLNLGYTRVESPISGIASRSQRSEGSLVQGPDVLLTTVVQVHPIWVYFGVPDNEQARLQKEIEAGRLQLPKNGFEVELRLADGTVFPHKGRVNFSDVRISAATGTRDARAEVPNPDSRLRPGEFVRVVLKGAVRPAALTVPQRAVLEGPQGKLVFIVDEKSTAQPRPVELGDWAGNDWIVTNGLKPGDRVIVDGLMKLGPGAPVKLADPNAQPKPPAQKKQ
ncbi:MAG: efflux RND transporter periplasmic adaptor subunit [Betaproteobacteria bacterium]|nr:efflux RND transporter periplasmic adaptor subunit [Betaproteobacteria bacterium]